jgi:hypothetical protein
MEYQNEINRCISLAKWNPSSAINDMYILKEDTIDSIIKEKMWLRAAKDINNFLDSLEKTRFYNEIEFWKNTKPSRLEI